LSVLYEHGTWSLTLREELSQRFMNRDLGNIVWPKWMEVIENGAIWSTVFHLPTGYLKIQRLKYPVLQLFVLYMGVTVASFTLQEEHMLRVFENRVLKKIFRSK
jgi:hypothetical protein